MVFVVMLHLYHQHHILLGLWLNMIRHIDMVLYILMI
nr:MAG TPA: hypothetical protein [Caudoviricetes sp.]